jgi:3-oxoacyl-[acyl-carrier-protein] synthase-3
VKPNSRILLPAFGAGLTFCAHFIRWGERVTPRGTTEVDLPPCHKTALEMVREQMRKREETSVSH